MPHWISDAADSAVNDLQKEVKNAGRDWPEIRGYECDTSSEDLVSNTWHQIVEDFGQVDVLVINAGLAAGSAAETDDFERRGRQRLRLGQRASARRLPVHVLQATARTTLMRSAPPRA
ncbi:hypothetical protein LTR84_005650 [Exophiala bonariae]|uniref:Uncharacterized protein n=1 Tax=Exophiala bonariae TaxID=1690606 RepID=A0AAV9N2Y4_9EURO|nr:hypothetical protein LTR84_005650 [Exophiala bonariae]